jgi:Predicted transcriptional regulators
MKLYLSENIKRLRRNSDITQDKLAEYLCVSPQTVSKWERAETYPDIEMLPALANFFNVTVDELIGNDKIKTESEIDHIIAEIKEKARLGNEEKALEMSRNSYKKYPYSYKMMSRYANDLCLYSDKEAWETSKDEVRRIANLILDECSDDQLRYNAIGMLGSVAKDEKELKDVCRRIPDGFDFTQELWLEGVYKINTPEGVKLRQKNMLELMWWFLEKVDELCGYDFNLQNGPKPDADVKIGVCKMKHTIFSTIFNDGDYIEYAWNMAYCSYMLAEAYLEKGDINNAVDAVERTADYTLLYRQMPTKFKHTSYLVNALEFNADTESAKGACGSPEDYLLRFKSSQFNVIRSDERFISAIEKLKSCPEGVLTKLEKDYK